MLIDPQEQLGLPASTIELRKGQGGQRKVVGQKGSCLEGMVIWKFCCYVHCIEVDLEPILKHFSC